MAITDAYYAKFTSVNSGYNQRSETKVLYNNFYEFLYEEEYEAWFCNLAKSEIYPRSLKDFLLRIHTGESFYSVTKDWSAEQRKKLGQQYLKNMAKSFINFYFTCEEWDKKKYKAYNDRIINRLELDGYRVVDGNIIEPEYEVLDVDHEKGILENLYDKLSLPDKDTAFEFLNLSELHYSEGRWSDCISNSRKFFEKVFSEVAYQYSNSIGEPLDSKRRERPFEVREYLESKKLLEKKEKEAIDKIYGLLSHTGGHPYMAESDQARLLRQIALLFTQFIMLKLEGIT